MRIVMMLILLLPLTESVYAAPPRCEDIPVSLTFENPVTASASMWNDIPGTPYTNGVIHYNRACDGSRDATVGTDPGRFQWLQFPFAITGSLIESGPPSFAGGSAFMTQVFINVRNITARNTGLVIPGPMSASFYTKVSFRFTGPDGNNYALGMMPDDMSCPIGMVCAPNFTPGPFLPTLNVPIPTAWAKVTYTPTPDTWLVEGEFVDNDSVTQRSTLFLEPRGNSQWIHNGQYSMPFRMVIKSLAPQHVIPLITVNDVSITEGNSGSSNATFTVTLSEPTSLSVSLNYGTTNGTAIAPGDYTTKSATLSIPPGSTSKTFTITIKGDRIDEPNETFFINLSNPANATIADNQGTCTIVDND
jgi:hypothetical protein